VFCCVFPTLTRGRFIYLFIYLLTDGLVTEWTDWLIDWLIGRSVGWLIDVWTVRINISILCIYAVVFLYNFKSGRISTRRGQRNAHRKCLLFFHKKKKKKKGISVDFSERTRRKTNLQLICVNPKSTWKEALKPASCSLHFLCKLHFTSLGLFSSPPIPSRLVNSLM
jgi:hypothetical protein